MTTAEEYAQFARLECRGVSPTYERLSYAVSEDEELLALLETVPEPKRQPNLLFGVVRLLGGPLADPSAFHAFVVDRWSTVAASLLTRATQTNEPGRCALLVPVLATLPQPLALLEVGASAGLLLYPDRYTYRYGGHVLGNQGPVLDCDLAGREPPERLPQIVWRAGLDANPLDVTDPGDVAWLDALIWPEHEHRRRRLRAAVEQAAADPPLLRRGDLVDDLPDLVAKAPSGATLVIFHSAVLYQVQPERRARFVELVRGIDAHWVAIEGTLPYDDLPPPPDDTAHNVLALDGRPLAWTRPHGQGMLWFGR